MVKIKKTSELLKRRESDLLVHNIFSFFESISFLTVTSSLTSPLTRYSRDSDAVYPREIFLNLPPK
jgi:hypothetical protein